MKLLLPLALALAVGLLPFVMLKQPWAVGLWSKIKLFLVIYVLVLIAATAVALIFRWDEIYG